ncbi:hypothetical protein HZB01_05390 [Candidatus Woesearchaeota archaeon]|nr:hypothetical protein [Candidatus Woesearchaeota archaeon]
MGYSNSSIDKTLKKAQANGATTCMPKQEIGKGMGWIAAFRDTEGNIMGLHEGGPEVSGEKTSKKQ